MSTTTNSSEPKVAAKSSIISLNVEQKCPIQYVTVYNDRAEVTRLVRQHFDGEGNYDLVFQGFSPFVDLTSLHVSGGTGKACTILEVSYQTRQEDAPEENTMTPLDQLQNDLRDIQEQIAQCQQESKRYSKQREWLEGRAAKLMAQEGQINVNDLDAMEKFMEFYYKTLLVLDGNTTKVGSQLTQLISRETALNEKIQQHGAEGQAQRRKTIREVTVSLHVAGGNVDVSLEISYLINNCSWSASYDVRVNSNDTARQKTQLTYYGSIVNQSQENWSDVKLSLSTATPSLGGRLPKLGTLRIGYKTIRYNYDSLQRATIGVESLCSAQSFSKKSAFMSVRAKRSLSSRNDYLEEADERSFDNTVTVLDTKTEASMSSSSFAIPRNATIEADGKPHKVTIGVLDLTSTFTYIVIPKLSTHAYLKASTTNTSDKQLLAGPASVFMDNNFVTHSSIDNVCLGDTFDLSLGTDSSVKVEYKPAKKLLDTQGLITKVKHENIRRETRLVNTKAEEVTVFVYEQVPLSSIEKVKVKLIVPDLRTKEQSHNCTVTMNDENNLEWKCILQPRGECRLPLEYSVEWPNDKSIEFSEN